MPDKKVSNRPNPLVQLRFTPAQAKAIKKFAEARGFSVAALARFAVISVVRGKSELPTSFEGL